MRVLKKTFFLCAAAILPVLLYAIEGVSPPQTPVRVEVQVEEEKNTLPKDFAELFLNSYHRFLAYPADSSFALGEVALGTGELYARGLLAFPKVNANLFSLYSIEKPKYSRAFADADIAFSPYGKVPSFLTLKFDYSRQEYIKPAEKIGYIYPLYLSGSLRDDSYYNWSTGLFALTVDVSGFYVSDYPSISGKDVVFDAYKEMGIAAEGEIYQYLAGKFGAFLSGRYIISRAGAGFLPRRGRDANGGIFYEFAPFIIKLGGSYAYCEDNYRKSFRPAAEIKLYTYTADIKISYGAGVRKNLISEYMFDRLTLEYPPVSPTVIESLGVQGNVNYRSLKITGKGVYGILKNGVYYSLASDTSKIVEIKKSDINLMTAEISGELRYNYRRIAFRNRLCIFANFSKLPDGHPVPNNIKYAVIDSLSIAPARQWKFFISGEYHSGYFYDENYTSYTSSEIANITAGISFQWRDFTFNLSHRFWDGFSAYDVYRTFNTNENTGISVAIFRKF